MFFILNDEGMVIAADKAFLEYSGAKSIYLLAEEFRLGNILLDDSKNEYQFGDQHSTFTKSPIQTLLGTGNIYYISNEEDELDTDNISIVDASIAGLGGGFIAKELLDTDSKEELEEDEVLELDDQVEVDEFKLDKEDEDDIKLDMIDFNEKENEHDLLSTDEEEMVAEDTVIALEKSDDEPANLDDELIDLVDDSDKPTQTEIADDKEAIFEEITINDTDIHTAPFANYQANAELIGITTEEYNGFLEQFTSEATISESSLRGMDLAVFKNSATSLKDAAQLLNLSALTDNLEDIQNATSDEKESLLDAFFQNIEHINKDITSKEDIAPETEIQQKDKADEEDLPSESITQDFAPEPHEQTHPKSEIASLNTENIEAIPFDFSAKTAADELGLPESLVDEFVSDFVDQAKENVSIFHSAQQNGDLETIQKTAHLLKGAASNLRIDPLAETLEALQHNESVDKVEPLFHKFLGQLKTLENFTGKTNILKG
jgi:HPt (histidine-containing phosphotransfer) domain-containing protein